MRKILHLLTRSEDPLARDLIERQSCQQDISVEVADLTKPGVDYEAIVEKIFEADSLQVW
jgi:hypothetical protein